MREFILNEYKIRLPIKQGFFWGKTGKCYIYLVLSQNGMPHVNEFYKQLKFATANASCKNYFVLGNLESTYFMSILKHDIPHKTWVS